jgi:hypothetical protein
MSKKTNNSYDHPASPHRGDKRGDKYYIIAGEERGEKELKSK